MIDKAKLLKYLYLKKKDYNDAMNLVSSHIASKDSDILKSLRSSKDELVVLINKIERGEFNEK